MKPASKISRMIAFIPGFLKGYSLNKSKSIEDIFTKIYKKNGWGGEESVSGVGSDLSQTRAVIQALPGLLRELNILSMLDIPCGDLRWMKTVDLKGIDYYGADIVAELIEKNRAQFRDEHKDFQRLNLVDDSLPTVDLIFCRDCLVHLSFEDIFRALDNICQSGSKYLLTTTFSDRKNNVNIATGGWRFLNLQLAPFNLPAPQKLIIEGCTQSGGAYADKSLGLWSISAIKASRKDSYI